MKKIFTFAVLLLSSMMLAACVTIANQAPVLTGIGFDEAGYKEVTIQVGDAYDPLEDVTAIDDKEGNITDKIEVTGFDEETINTPGTHEITLRVVDQEGLEASLKIHLIVESEDKPPVFQNVDTEQTYYIGSGEWDPLENVVAWENEDGIGDPEFDITGDIIVRDNEGVHYTLDTPGTYNIRLRITNQAGVQANITIRLSVERPDIPLSLPTTAVTATMWHAMGNDITLWMRNQATNFRNEYLAQGYDFTIDVKTGTGTYEALKSQMVNAIVERDLPNLIQGYPDHVAEYLNGGAIANLTPYIYHTEYGLNGADDLNDILESYRDENTQYDAARTFYSLPMNKSTEVLVYNKAALEYAGITDEADVPKTWQGWFEIADDLIAYGKTKNPTEVNLVKAGAYDSEGNAFITFTRQFGGSYTDINLSNRKGIYLWHTDPLTTSAMQFVKDNRDVFSVPNFWGQDYSTTAFAEEKIAFVISSSAGLRHIENEVKKVGADFEFGAVPIPYNAEMPDNRTVIQQGTNISVVQTGSAEQRLISWLFLKYLMRTDVTVDLSINTGYLPVRQSGYESERFQQFLNQTLPGITDEQRSNAISVRAAIAQSEYLFYDPAFVGSSKARNEVGIAFQRIVSGDGNIAEALLDAYREASLGQ